MDKKAKKAMCVGCSNNFYNHAGNSTTGECWSLEKATVVERTKVGVWQNPPYRWSPHKTLDCHTPDGERWICRDDVRLIENGAKS